MAGYDVPNYGTVLECPYNKSHLIATERMQKHLIRCRRQYPNAKIVECRFNTAHHVPEQELSLHLKQCPFRAHVDTFMFPVSNEKTTCPPDTGYYGTNEGMQVAGKLTTMAPAPDEENWDDMDAPAYNPAVYCAQNPVIRKAMHKTASKKRQFYDDEQFRMAELRKQNL
uniref:CHHC U11-48K-type domain-containing protein n=1 Tax=Anopheles farauti TaxID=69004 RepID=A0A182QFD0_9DIPT